MQRAKKANDLVTWVNGLLATNEVRTLDDLKTGVHLVQLVHSLDPDAFDLARVDFRASNDYYYARNLKLLQDVLGKIKVKLEFNLEGVAQGEKRNDLFGLVGYLKLHYETLKDRIHSGAATTYDAALERRRAQERRNSRHKPFRVAQLAATTGGSGGVVPRPSGAFSDTATVVSDMSMAGFSSYTTLSARNRCSRMRLRHEELEKWASKVQLPMRRVSSYDGLAHAAAAAAGGAGSTGSSEVCTGSARTPIRAGSTATQPTRISRLAICDVAEFELVDLKGGDLACMSAWPSDLEPDVWEHGTTAPGGSGSPRGAAARSPLKNPGAPAGAMLWTALDSVLMELSLAEELRPVPGA
jgi:hypothetical protein